MGGVVKSVGGFLFGEDEGEPEPVKSERYTPAQMKLISQLSKLLSEQLGGEEGEPVGVEPYPGQMYAGEQPLQSALFSFLSGAPDLARSLQQTGMQFLTDQTPYDYGAERQYWEQAFAAPTREAFYEETVPQLQEMFAGQGALDSSGFNRALAREARRMETGLGGQLADILYQGQQSYLDRQLQQRGVGLSALGQALAQVGLLPAAGQMQQQIAQAPLTEAYQKWEYQQPYRNPWLPLISPTLGAVPYQIDTVVPQGSTGLLGAMAPGFGKGLGGAFGNWLFPTARRVTWL